MMNEIFAGIQGWFQANGALGLALNAWMESFLVLPPPDILLVALDISNPNKSLYYALIATICTTIGGLTGWFLGKIGGRPFFNWVFSKKKDLFEKVEELYEKWGITAVVVAAMTPIPYNIFAWGSGILNMNWLLFGTISFVCRGLRYFLISTLLMLFGESIKQNIKSIVLIGSLLLVIAYIIVMLIIKNKKAKNEINEQ